MAPIFGPAASITRVPKTAPSSWMSKSIFQQAFLLLLRRRMSVLQLTARLVRPSLQDLWRARVSGVLGGTSRPHVGITRAKRTNALVEVGRLPMEALRGVRRVSDAADWLAVALWPSFSKRPL